MTLYEAVTEMRDRRFGSRVRRETWPKSYIGLTDIYTDEHSDVLEMEVRLDNGWAITVPWTLAIDDILAHDWVVEKV